MTSLSRQLESLASATSAQLTVEAQHPSLLFERKEAAALDRETVHKIGATGFAQLLKIDAAFAADEELFDETSIELQRLQMTADASSALNDRVYRFLARLSPYLQHFAAQQALEWLIFKFHIHSHCAEFLLINFLPFHESNIYGRLLGTLQYNFVASKDFGFLKEFAKRKQHLPFPTLVKAALAGSHSLLSRVIAHLERCVELVGEDYLETKASLHFTFLAKLLLETLNPTNPIDDALLAKIVPVVANGIRSKLSSLRYASLMVVCQLALSAKLTPAVVNSLLKLLIMKLRSDTLMESLTTIAVLMQQQTVETLSVKATCKWLRNEELLTEIVGGIRDLARTTDLTRFLTPLWTTLLEIHGDPALADLETAASELFVGSLEALTEKQFAILLSTLLTHLSSGGTLPRALHDEVHGLVARYNDEFDRARTAWKVQDEKALSTMIAACSLDELLMIEGTSDEGVKKGARRKRRSTHGEEAMETDEPVPVKQNPLDVARAAASSMTEAVLKREKFSGDPIAKCTAWIKEKDWDKVEWALEEMASRPAYLEKQVPEDREDLFLELLKLAVDRPSGMALRLVDVMSSIPVSDRFVHDSLVRQDTEGSAAKKKKGPSDSPSFVSLFTGESDESWRRRLVVTLQVLSLTPKLAASAALLRVLFDFIGQMSKEEATDEVHNVQAATVAVLLRVMKAPGTTYKIQAVDLRMDAVVETMRSTLSHHLLRDSLRLLTAAVQIAPSSVVSHVLSIFTFMGAGLLKKDNELTLSIMEDTLNALFTAVVAEGRKEEIERRLVEVCKIFASSIGDIPAHRRARAAHAIARAVGEGHVPTVLAVFVEGFNARWQRSTGGDTRGARNAEQDAYEDMASELLRPFPAVGQLSILLHVVAHVIRMGGDAPKKADSLSPLDRSIFDRGVQSTGRLRHFRFLLLGVVVRVLAQRNLVEELASSSDSSLLSALVPVARRLLAASVDLDEFTTAEATRADGLEGAEAQQAVRYWLAFGSRAEVVADKLRHLLPGAVAAQLITTILKDPKTDARLREKAMQLSNVKLMAEGGFSPDPEENDRLLNGLAETMNDWILPVRTGDKMLLCQHAAFSLKLIAKYVRPTADSAVLAKTMENACKTLTEWQTIDDTLVGNTLLLAGELVRTHNMRATLLSAAPLMTTCCAILTDAIKRSEERERTAVADSPGGSSVSSAAPATRRARIRQQSLCGRRLGSDTMLICALTCSQRLLDHLGRFVSASLPQLLMLVARLAPRFGLVGGRELEGPSATREGRGSIESRLALIRRALLALDLRLVLPHALEIARGLRDEEKPLSWVLSLLASSFAAADGPWLAKQATSLVDGLFRPLLEYRARERREEMLDAVASTESSVIACFLAFIDTLTERQIRPLTSSLFEWAEEGLQTGADLAARLRLPTVFHLANAMYSSMNTLSLVYFPRLFETAAKTMAAVNYANASSPLYSLKRGEVSAAECHFLIGEILSFVTSCAKQPGFFTADRWKLISGPLIDELENSKVEGHEARCVALADALYPALEVHPDTLGDTLQAILNKIREGRAKLRYRCLLVVERLAGRIGEGLAPHLPLLMPALSELMEDENRTVEEQTEKIVRLLQRKFGEDISEGFV